MSGSGDADVAIVALWRRYTDWLREYMPSSYANLAPGASADDLATVAEVVGHALPLDVRALLSVNNGQLKTGVSTAEEDDAPAFPHTCLLSTSLIVDQWREWRDLEVDDDESMQAIGGSLVPQVVKPYYTNRHWVPLLNASFRSDFFGLDFDPGPAGNSGQVINFGRDEEYHYLAAPDLTRLLEIIVPAVIAAGPRPQPATTPDRQNVADADLDLDYWADYPGAFTTVYRHHHPADLPNRPAV